MNEIDILKILVKVISNVIFIQCLSGVSFVKKNMLHGLLPLFLVLVNYGIEIIFFKHQVVVVTIRIIFIFIFLIIITKKELLTLFSITLLSFILTDLLQSVLLLLAFPISKFSGGKIGYESSATISYFMLIIFSILIYKFLFRKAETILTSNSRKAKVGICIISSFIEGIFILFRMEEYEKNNDSLYIMMLLFIGFSSTILFFWIWDKMEEQKKIRELTSYAHKTSEVIPTIHRIIKDNDLFEDNEKMVMLMKELQSVCESDSKEVQQDCKSMKTFAPTGCMMLDKQLQRYLEEAEMEQFYLDIIVQAPVKKILQEQMIDVKGLIQVVGDLYKNAKKSIKVEKSRQNILICFGYLTKNCYQISVFDTGIPFPEQVLKNFGTRGITTNGTGNGLADIRKTLENGRASIIVSHDVPAGNTFTKEVSVVFDGMYDIEIK